MNNDWRPFAKKFHCHTCDNEVISLTGSATELPITWTFLINDTKLYVVYCPDCKDEYEQAKKTGVV